MRRPHRQDDRGFLTIEFVFLLPLLLMLIFAVASVGMYFFKQTDVRGQAYNAARTLALTGSVAGLPAGSTTTACAVGVPNAIVIWKGGTYTFSIPLVTLIDKPLTATGTYPCNPS